MRKEVLTLCATVLFYDHGYKSVKGISNLDKTWSKRMEDAYLTGSETNPLQNNIKGKVAYVDKFEEAHPKMIRKLYRKATAEIGCQASWKEIAVEMNKVALTMDGLDEVTKFNSNNVRLWFKAKGGKEKSPLEKPYLTEDQKKERKKWCEDEKARIAQYGDQYYACFLDEKWFYTTSRRRRVKHLPPDEDEDPKEVAPKQPTSISRRFSTKVCPR